MLGRDGIFRSLPAIGVEGIITSDLKDTKILH